MWSNYTTSWLQKAKGQLTKSLRNLGQLSKQNLTESLKEIEFFLRGGISMVDLYVALIIAGRRTLSQVPLRFKADVEADLQALGIIE